MSPRLAGLLIGSSALLCATSVIAEDSSGSTALSGVTVTATTAPREEVVARKRQQEAPNLVAIQPAEIIQQYPDFNAAEALGRIPGVSLSTDTGEGRFVNIRGIDGNLAGATFGGVPLLNTYPGGTYFGGGGRAVEFDTVPIGSIDGIVVTYTPLPDHEAESLGGTVELTPRTAASVTKPFLEAQAGWGYEPIHDHTGPVDLEVAAGVRFGFAGARLAVEGMGEEGVAPGGFITNPTPFAIVLTASRRDDRRGFDDIEEDYNEPGIDRTYSDIQLRRYNYHRRRFGYGGEFDFTPNDDHHYYFRANVAGYTEAVAKNRLTYFFDPEGLGQTPSSDGGYTTDASFRVTSTEEQETHRNQVYAVGGFDRFGDVTLDYRASYSRATYHQDYNYGAKFNSTGSALIPNFFYNNAANNGDYPVLDGDDALVNDPANYKPAKSVSNSTENDVDEEWAYAANLSFPVKLIRDGDHVQLGGEVRLRTKSSTPYAFESDFASPLAFSAASTSAITNFYGQYTNGPQVCLVCVHNAYAAGSISSDGTLPDGQDQSGTFGAKEDIYAGYAEYLGQVGTRFSYVVGVRVEATDATYSAFSNDNPSMGYLPVSRAEDYINAFPSVQLKYRIRDDMQIRAIYSTGIGRPGFLQNTAATTSNFDPSAPNITQGNPNLKPTTGQNFDVSYEWYLGKSGIFQVALFDKEFSNYIVTENQYLPYSGSYGPFQGETVLYTTFANRGGAYARGVQLAFNDQFTFLPGALAGFGVEANATFVDSHILEYDAATSSSGENEYGLLPGTSHTTWNLAGFYDKYGVKLRISAEYVSKELFSLGGTKSSDTIQDDRLTLDWSSAYQLNSHVGFYFNVKNITNTPLRFFVYNSSYPIQREYYEQTFEAGVRVKF